mmetsp:Transcript_8113/g.17582  ORF Transcript_8113/g.17582 Transcript_8113/m.17582 type:complete len:86 (-) Transcript_8113:1722-1979(-)
MSVRFTWDEFGWLAIAPLCLSSGDASSSMECSSLIVMCSVREGNERDKPSPVLHLLEVSEANSDAHGVVELWTDKSRLWRELLCK